MQSNPIHRETGPHRRSLLTWLALAPFAVAAAGKAAAAARWIRLGAGGSGTNRFSAHRNGGRVWAVCHNVTYRGARLTGRHRCRVTTSAGRTVATTVLLDASGSGTTGKIRAPGPQQIIGILVGL